MSRNRFCERIGRQHKSNHVMYVVDLRRALYYQKCHDPDCRGYRSPLRLVPMDSIPDPSFFLDSGPMVQQRGLMHSKLEDQFFDNNQECDLQCSNEHDVESCSKESWWLEAIKVADDLENKPKALELSNMEIINDDKDDYWWIAAETTVSQAEQKCTSTNLRVET